MGRPSLLAQLALAAALFGVPPVASAFDHDELADGDLSNDRLAPTHLSLAPALNVLAMTSGSSSGSVDRDYFTFSVPEGWQLEAIWLLTAHTDGVAFIGVMHGPLFTEPPLPTRVENLLGWHHFSGAEVGADLLEAIGTGAGGQGFIPPLGPGSYSFWAQDFGSVADYAMAFDLTPVPEPGTQRMLGFGLAGLAAACRRRASREVDRAGTD